MARWAELASTTGSCGIWTAVLRLADVQLKNLSTLGLSAIHDVDHTGWQAVDGSVGDLDVLVGDAVGDRLRAIVGHDGLAVARRLLRPPWPRRELPHASHRDRHQQVAVGRPAVRRP